MAGGNGKPHARIISLRSTELDLLETARSESGLWNAFEEIVGELGFPFYVYLFSRADGSLFCRTNVKQRHYPEPRHDPFLKYGCANTGVSFTGAEYLPTYSFLNRDEVALIRRAEGAGWRTGVAVPVRMRIHREYGGFNLGTRLTRAEFEVNQLDKIDRVRAICLTTQRRIEELGFALSGDDRERRERFQNLTLREIQMFDLMAEGLSRAQIAERAGISPLTVSTHIKAIYRKLGISSQRQAMRLAWQLPS